MTEVLLQPCQMTPNLSERLRSETRTLHATAESTPIMRSLLRCEIDETRYVALLSNLLMIYSALEPALDRNAAHPVLSRIAHPAIRRAAALRADLSALKGGDWRESDAIVSATVAYAKRIEAIDLACPQLLLAHAYVRYLGDLSGGQVLKRVVSSNPMLKTPVPVAFYDFGDATTTASLAKTFRTGLASVVLSPLDEDAVVAEAKLAFELHITLFNEL
ncbi:biliverdin-producing heme oxygenase [Aquabacterium sp.]|uniref:biliverdin-producing heme oxygenase n=1 Tax=Aquabacterium sp. TaxID=1872578 RepID=UPI0019BE2306|nr:biliverdin-producing heme oxygenase [Aquabacterium sp.]MBC7699819.1 biliverdin-producing heme oxygenase [Aquabacterium sp.]